MSTIFIPRDVLAQLAKFAMTSDDDKTLISNVAIDLNEKGDVITIRQTDGYRASTRKIVNHTRSFPSIESITPSPNEKIGWAELKVSDVKRLIDVLKLDKASKDNKSPTTTLTFDVARSALIFEISNGASVTVPVEGRIQAMQDDPRIKIGYNSRFLRECLGAALEIGLKHYDFATIQLSWYVAGGELARGAALRPLVISASIDSDVTDMLLMPVRI